MIVKIQLAIVLKKISRTRNSTKTLNRKCDSISCCWNYYWILKYFDRKPFRKQLLKFSKLGRTTGKSQQPFVIRTVQINLIMVVTFRNTVTRPPEFTFMNSKFTFMGAKSSCIAWTQAIVVNLSYTHV